jgi:hypothetical protein
MNFVKTTTFNWVYRGRNTYGRAGMFADSEIVHLNLNRKAAIPGLDFFVNKGGKLQLTKSAKRELRRGQPLALTVIEQPLFI